MSVSVHIRDDPERPEGGHALVLFRGIAGPTGRGTLCIEPSTENYQYGGPREIEIHASREADGLLVPVGDGALDQLEPGTAVRLSISGTNIEAETLWPNLTPRPRAQKRRLPMAPGRRREVVEPASGGGPRSPNRSDVSGRSTSRTIGTEIPETREFHQQRHPDDPPPSEDTSVRGDQRHIDDQGAGIAGPADEPHLAGTNGGSAEPRHDSQSGAQDGGPSEADRPPHETKETEGSHPDAHVADTKAPRRGWSTAVVSGIAAAAFVLGGAVSFVLHPSSDRPSKGQMPRMAAPASLYAPLASLPQVSPEGVNVQGHDWRKFVTRSRNAETAEERTFWRKWAIRAALEDRSNGVATTLVDFATDLADSNPDDATLASARLLWELAAVAGDCGAMSNIAKAYAHHDRVADETLWNDRARRCIGNRPQK